MKGAREESPPPSETGLPDETDPGAPGSDASVYSAVKSVLGPSSTAIKAWASLTIAIAVWWFISTFNIVNPTLFPPPTRVWSAFFSMAREGVLLSDLKVSLGRAVTGFFIGAIPGIIVGLVTAQTKVFRFLLNPVLTVLRPIPAIALVPVAIVWFGIGEGSKHFVIGYTVFLVSWFHTHHGVEFVAPTYILAAESLGASRARIFREVLIPAVAPHIVAGLRLGATVAFLSLVAAELTGASAGIGFRLQEARQFLRTDRMFVGLIELGLLGAALDSIFVFLSRKVIHWEGA